MAARIIGFIGLYQPIDPDTDRFRKNPRGALCLDVASCGIAQLIYYCIGHSMSTAFQNDFELLTGYQPFPWQKNLYDEWFGQCRFPERCRIPTGLGKTNVIAVWLLALKNDPDRIPRRLVYVVNRRTVVDQTTAEVERLRENVNRLNDWRFDRLAVSTLRGQFADNRNWSRDPSKPAIICGTVDMIGSRLLFSGYGVGYKARPLHAGFLGQDVLLVHDEAHLEPAFQELICEIQEEQSRCKEFGRFHIMELTATSRIVNGDRRYIEEEAGLTDEDHKHPMVMQRIEAKKQLKLSEAADDKAAVKVIIDIAKQHKDNKATVLVYVQSPESVKTIEQELEKTGCEVLTLTGTMRGKERDELVNSHSFKKFKKNRSVDETIYLACTSAGEVGIDISADHLVCDLSTFDSMTQRLGRVNRYGDPTDHVALVDVVYPSSFGKIDKKTGELIADKINQRRQHTLELIKQLSELDENLYDASLLALRKLDINACSAAFSPEPDMLPTSDILFDAWSMTSIRGRMPGRPPVEPYLHGIKEWEPYRTSIAWRKEVELITVGMIESHRSKSYLQDLLDDYPLLPRELLSDTSERVFIELFKLAEHADDECRYWLIDDHGDVTVDRIRSILDTEKKAAISRFANGTILLPPSIGGLSKKGLFDGTAESADDVADNLEGNGQRRVRRLSNEVIDQKTLKGMRLIRSIVLNDSDVGVPSDDPLMWLWYETAAEGGRTAPKPVLWETHTQDVKRPPEDILKALSISGPLGDAILCAADFHDHGKQRERFQTTLGNHDYPNRVLAKSGGKGLNLSDKYRHEFGSLLDVSKDTGFKKLDPEFQDLALHLIASHHGRARPGFKEEEAFDDHYSALTTDDMVWEVPRRFFRLQRRFGRWGLAYLESLLRSADWAASANPSVYAEQANEVEK
jgi:CRISPR-associated endonuclease/helicase Cas3